MRHREKSTADILSVKEELMRWKSTAESLQRDNKAILGMLNLRTQERDAARAEALSNSKTCVDTKMELLASKYAAAETEKAILLKSSDKFAALVAEVSREKVDADRVRRQTAETRQEITSLSQQFALLATERDAAINETIRARQEVKTMRLKIDLMTCSKSCMRACAKDNKFSHAQKERGAAVKCTQNNEMHVKKITEVARCTTRNRLHFVQDKRPKAKSAERITEAKCKRMPIPPHSDRSKKDELILGQKLSHARQAKASADQTITLLRRRCLILEHQLQVAESAELCWREERAFLCASASNADLAIRSCVRESYVISNRNLGEVGAEKAEFLGRILLKDPSSDNLVKNTHAGTRGDPEYISVRRVSSSQDCNSGMIGCGGTHHWDVAPASSIDVNGHRLLERLGLRGFAAHIVDLAFNVTKMDPSNCESQAWNSKKTAIVEEIIANKIAEIATIVKRMKYASTRWRTKLKTLLGIEVAKLAEVNKPARRHRRTLSNEWPAKRIATLRYVHAVCLHAKLLRGTHLLRLQLSSLQIDDDFFLSIVHMLVAMKRSVITEVMTAKSCFPPSLGGGQDSDTSVTNKLVRLSNEAYATLPVFNLVSHLNLHGNTLGDTAASSLAVHLVPILPVLTILDLRGNRISDSGARALKHGVERNQTVLRATLVAHHGGRLDASVRDLIICGWREHTYKTSDILDILDNTSIQADADAALYASNPRHTYLSPVFTSGTQNMTLPLVVDLRNNLNITRHPNIN